MKNDTSKSHSTVKSPSNAEEGNEVVPETEERDYIDKYIEEGLGRANVVVLGKRWCPATEEADKLLKKTDDNDIARYTVLLLDTLEQGMGLTITERLDIFALPCVFVRGQKLGGLLQLQEAIKTGLLVGYLNGVPLEEYEYDVVVLGGGPAGLETAVELGGGSGKKVALFDDSPRLGGTANRAGTLHATLFHDASSLSYEVNTETPPFAWGPPDDPVPPDWAGIVQSVRTYSDSISEDYKACLKSRGVDYFNQKAKLDGPNHVEFGGDRVCTKNVVIAVGCEPVRPDFLGAEEFCITSDELFSLEYMPGKTLIVGGSCLAVELASTLLGLGSDVTIMMRGSLLKDWDREMVDTAERHLTQTGVSLLIGCRPLEVTRSQEGSPPSLNVVGEWAEGSGYADTFNTVLLATGRRPRTGGLGLEEAGVKLDKDGCVVVDSRGRSSKPSIFAVGDVAVMPTSNVGVPRRLSGTLAIEGGNKLGIFLRGCSGPLPDPVDYGSALSSVRLPQLLELASTGYSEEAARLVFPSVVTYQRRPSNRGLYEHTPATVRSLPFFKVVCAPDVECVERVVGIHLMGRHARVILIGYSHLVKVRIRSSELNVLAGAQNTYAEAIAGPLGPPRTLPYQSPSATPRFPPVIENPSEF